MNMKVVFIVPGLAGLLISAAVGGDAYAQTYPAKPMRIINPMAPGGSNDIVGRMLAKTMAAELGQSAYVENRPGAGGNIGTELVAKAPPDGYTLLVVLGSFAINPSLMKQVPYDPIKDFECISKISSYMYFLTAHPSTPARSVQQLIALAKAKPDQVTYGTSGIGGTAHLAGELLKSMAEIRIVHVAYKGGAPAMLALLSGEVALSFNGTSVFPHLQSGKLRPLGVTGLKRMSAAPDVPTIAESGVPGYEVVGWNALFAPAGTPAPIVDKLNQLVRRWLTNPETKAAMEAQGLDPEPGTPQELGEMVRTELVKWAKVIKAAGIKPE